MAFNATRVQFDLYGRATATTVGGTPTWFDGNFTNTQTGAPVTGTGFNVTIPKATSANQNVTWTAINIPKGNVSSTTILRFDWRGTVGNGTKASYFVYNGTSKPPIFPPVTKINQTTIGGGPPSIITPSAPVGCAPTDECYDVSKYIGFNLTLTFAFNSTSSGKGLSVRVSNIAVVSADASPINSNSHTMKLDPTQVRVIHNATMTLRYFANVTYHRPNTVNMNLNHNWTQMIITYSYPNSYTSVGITQNGTSIFPLGTPVPIPIAQGNCPASFFCTDSHFVALNMTSPMRHAAIIITANSLNAEAGVQTTLGGVATSYWGPGDLLQVKVNLRQGVNVTGLNIVSANRTGSVRLTQTFANIKKGMSLENFTSPLPQDTFLLGQWTVNSTFINGYDYGYNSTSFTFEQLEVSGFTYSGSNQRLTTGGTLTYASNGSPAPNVNGYVFALDTGSGAAPLSTPTVTSSAGIYVSNITLLNGVFTTGRQLIMTFTLVNPTQTAMKANLTIDHEWVSGMPHGSNATISAPSGAGTFTYQPPYVYRLNATFTPGGIQVIITGTGNSVSLMLPPGNPPVTSLRQHSGLFRITVNSAPVSGSTPCVPACKNSLESPAYAYVLVNPPLPGRLLASGSFTSTPTGVFSAILGSGKILGASKLTFLSLGRDANGLGITVQGQSTQESTILQTKIDNIPTVTQNQPLTLVIHLTSTSTVIDMNLTISLNVEGSGVVKNQSNILIPHGTTKDVSFNFNAPAKIGTYSLTFFSPDYGAPLITGTLQVSALQSNLQVIIPAIIGLAAAIVILLFFLFRKKPDLPPESPAKDKTASGKPTKPNPGTSTSKSLT